MEVENVRVVVRIKPMSQEELDDGVEDLSETNGQVLTLRSPSSGKLFRAVKTKINVIIKYQTKPPKNLMTTSLTTCQ